MPRQLAFDLPVRPALGREDFFVSPANEAALGALDAWRKWPSGRMVLAGPPGSGKTHLAHVWAEAAGARIVPASSLADTVLPELASGPLVVEDADRDTPASELLHLLNLAADAASPVLLTACEPPARWGVALADLRSRLEAIPVARLAMPDDRLLQAVLLKHFADRGIEVRPSLVPWLSARIDRSLASAAETVARLDRVALERGVRVSRALAAEILDLGHVPDP